MMDGRAGYNARAPMPSGTRRTVLELLTTSDMPLSAADIASRIQLHVTTVRFHLEQLENASLVRRMVKRQGQRGRPQILFAAAAAAAPSAREDNANLHLVDVLAGAVSTDTDGGRTRAIEAGNHWADILAPDVARTGDDGPGPLIRVMERLGFEPQLVDSEPEHVIQLLACPFRQSAREYPDVVCSVHRGLIERMLVKMGHPADDATLHPFVQPDLCTVTLHGLTTPTASRLNVLQRGDH